MLSTVLRLIRFDINGVNGQRHLMNGLRGHLMNGLQRMNY